MNIFSNLQVSKSFTSIELNNVLEAIKTGVISTSSTTLSTGAVEASKEDKYSTEIFSNNRNKYNHLKTSSVMTWCPNAMFLNNHRHSTKVDKLSGYIYCDIDGVDPITVKDKVSKSPFVHAAWKSLSGTGIGFLVKADWTVDNFKENYTALSRFFKTVYRLDLDKTSDITRTNVFSYDPDIYINDNASNIPSTALSPFTDAGTTERAKRLSNPITFDSTIKSNLEELTEELGIEIDYDTRVTTAINYAIKSKGAYEEGNKYNFLTSFVGTCTTMSVPFEIMMQGFEKYAESIYMEVYEDVMEKLYSEFEGQGTSFIDSLTYSSVNNLKINRTITVDQYLDSQLPTVFTKNTILVAPTGAGKSTYVMESLTGKRIIITPNTAILRSFKSFKGVSVFYGDEKSEKLTDIIVTTQDSFSNLVNVLESKGKSVLDYLVVIDEFHTLVTSANYTYKYNAINSVMEVLEQYPVTVLGLTATPIKTVTNDFYNSFEVINVIQKKATKRLVKLAEYTDYRSFIIEKCVSNYETGVKTIVYKNDKRNVDVVAEALTAKGLKVVVINADQKEELEYNIVVEQGILNCDVILTTSLLKEGVSVKSDKPVAVDYIVNGDAHYTDINQLSSRVRNASSITITLASSETSYKSYSLPFFYDSIVSEIDTVNKFLIPRFNTNTHTEVELKLDQRALGSSIKLNEDTLTYEVDSVYKDYLIFEAERKICTINPLYTITMLLTDTRFDVATTITKYSQDNKELVAQAKDKVQEKKIDTQLNFKDVVDNNAKKTIIAKLDDIYETGTQQEQTMAYYTKFVYSRMKKANVYCAIDQAKEFADSSRKFKEFKIQLQLTSLFNDKQSGNSISDKFFKEVQKNIKLNKEYTSNEVLEVFKKAASKTEAKDFMKVTKTKSTQWLKLMGKVVDKVTKDKNRKTVRTFTVSSWGLSNFNYTPRFDQTIAVVPTSKLFNPYIGV